jgi:hypothetical protein
VYRILNSSHSPQVSYIAIFLEKQTKKNRASIVLEKELNEGNKKAYWKRKEGKRGREWRKNGRKTRNKVGDRSFFRYASDSLIR